MKPPPNSNVELVPAINFGKRDPPVRPPKQSDPDADWMRHAATATKIRSAVDGVAGSLRGSVFRINLYVEEFEKRGGDPAQVAEFRRALEVMAATSATLVTIVGTNNSITLDKASKERSNDL